MKMKQQNLITALLVASLVMGMTANAVSSVRTCLPKACCCTAARAQQIHQENHGAGPVHCLPEKPAPCCQIEQDAPQPAMALTATPEITSHRWSMAVVASNHQGAGQQVASMLGRQLDHSPPKAPTTPVYLLTQVILC